MYTDGLNVFLPMKSIFSASPLSGIVRFQTGMVFLGGEGGATGSGTLLGTGAEEGNDELNELLLVGGVEYEDRVTGRGEAAGTLELVPENTDEAFAKAVLVGFVGDIDRDLGDPESGPPHLGGLARRLACTTPALPI